MALQNSPEKTGPVALSFILWTAANSNSLVVNQLSVDVENTVDFSIISLKCNRKYYVLSYG